MYKPILKKGAPKYKKSTDYCTMSLDEIFRCRYNLACYWHDRQYRNQIVNRRSRFMADLDLWKGIVIECWKVRKSSIFWSWYVGRTYFNAARLFGNGSYL